VKLRGSHAAKRSSRLVGRYGRIRTVVRAPDGSLWIATSNRDGRGSPRAGDDRIVRIAP
jgi:glucose/arabinose dehydrogenase